MSQWRHDEVFQILIVLHVQGPRPRPRLRPRLRLRLRLRLRCDRSHTAAQLQNMSAHPTAPQWADAPAVATTHPTQPGALKVRTCLYVWDAASDDGRPDDVQ